MSGKILGAMRFTSSFSYCQLPTRPNRPIMISLPGRSSNTCVTDQPNNQRTDATGNRVALGHPKTFFIRFFPIRSQPVQGEAQRSQSGAIYGPLGSAGSRRSEVMDVLRNWQHTAIANGHSANPVTGEMKIETKMSDYNNLFTFF